MSNSAYGPTGRHLAVVTLYLCLALLAALLLDGCSKAQDAEATLEPSIAGDEVSFPDHKDPPGVRLVSVGNTVARTLSVPGRLTWEEDHTTRVFAPYAGRIERLRVAVGQSVQRGQPLADIASADIGQAQADLHKSQADLMLARAALERARDLSEGGVVARKDLLQAEADHARAQAEAARARARVAQYGMTTDTV
ncbi:MAG TPA: efflux RND transporter periplasmic adaptor subunit, partial [Burkholderiaceae bacterium]